MASLEYCCECDEATGNAGIHDGSLYLDDGTGPYCGPCFYRNSYEVHEAEIERLSAEVTKANRLEREAFGAGMLAAIEQFSKVFNAAKDIDFEQTWQQYRCQDDTDWKATDSGRQEQSGE